MVDLLLVSVFSLLLSLPAIQAKTSNGDRTVLRFFDNNEGTRKLRGGNIFNGINENYTTRIVGGSVASENRYPYFAFLKNASSFCGGTLICPDVVLTAAHCRGKVLVEVGRSDLSETDSDHETFRIVEEFPHPYFDEIGKGYDRMLIKLSSPSKNPVITINRNPEFPRNEGTNSPLTVVGFGKADNNGLYPAKLQSVELQYIPNEICSQRENADLSNYKGLIHEDVLCAEGDGAGVCFGDSGGPIISQGQSPAEDVLVGTGSWTKEPCGSLPGVFQRVTEEYRWLRETVCLLSDFPPDAFDCPPKVPTFEEEVDNPTSEVPNDGPSLRPSDGATSGSESSGAPSLSHSDLPSYNSESTAAPTPASSETTLDSASSFTSKNDVGFTVALFGLPWLLLY